MKKKFVFVGVVLGVCVIISVAVLLFTRTNVDASPTPALEECQTLQYSSEDAINIVFMADAQAANDYMEYMFEYIPFSETRDRFNVYLIDTASYAPECELYRGIALYCYSREVVQKAASCPNDYIIVLREQPRSIRSSAFRNVMSLNTNVPKTVLLHELGHAIAFFAEEYLAPGATIPRKAENCAVKCDDFSGLNEDCLEECTTASHYRSIDEGLMRTLYPPIVTYGEFDNGIMKKQILEQSSAPTPGITGNALAEESGSCETQAFRFIEGSVDETGDFKVVKTSVQPGCASGTGYGETKITLFDEQGRLISEEFSNIDTMFIDSVDIGAEGDDSAPVQYRGSVYFAVPEDSSAATAEITRQDKTTFVAFTSTGAEACRI